MTPEIHYADLFFFGIYPYVCLAIFLLGSLVRYDREQYTWKSDSSQLLYPGLLRVGSRLMHVGILVVFFGHLVGLLTPIPVWHFLGFTAYSKTIMAMSVGGFFGGMAWIGMLLLLYRRFCIERVSVNSSWRDKMILVWIFITLSLGLSTIAASYHGLGGDEVYQLMRWAQHLVTFRPSAFTYMAEIPFIFKLHIFFGLTFFAIFPFTRMVHVWSGFASVLYLFRPWQVVRRR